MSLNSAVSVLAMMVWSVLCVRAQDQQPDGWAIFSRVKFSEKFFKEENTTYLYPLFDTRIRAYEGKEVVLTGHYIPWDVEDHRVMIVSKFPNNACFFCGGAGPETVAEVYFAQAAPRLKADQVITVRGKLKLNDRDVDHMNFILTGAVWVRNP